MSNNRMFLRCRTCGARLLLGKLSGAQYYCYYYNMTKYLDDFFENHAVCDKRITKNEIPYENQFELEYEFKR